jgi:hypothetical protein
MAESAGGIGQRLLDYEEEQGLKKEVLPRRES